MRGIGCSVLLLLAAMARSIQAQGSDSNSVASSTQPPPSNTESVITSITGSPVSSSISTSSSESGSVSGSGSMTSLSTTSSSGNRSTITSGASSVTQRSLIKTNTVPTASPTTYNGTMVGSNQPPLPIKPRLSPALGVAGAILLISGIAYTFIGARSRGLQIFFSVGYIVALAITVLLAYVGSQGVNDAKQGGYFVAIVLPSAVVAGISLIFPDATESIACPFGGFCFAMWLLCLAPGGSIHSVGGRIGLIVAFMVIFWSSYFLKKWHIREYGLIGSIASGGSTAIMLGIDCFSRAGLKEFWLYLWNVNPNVFPLNTITYPTTRGIKVETAMIIIIGFFSIMSQMRLWKIIKDKRKKQQQQDLEDAEDRDRLDALHGRIVEFQNVKERAQWEAVYNASKGRPYNHSSIGGSTFGRFTDDSSRPESSKTGPAVTVTRVGSNSDDLELEEVKNDSTNRTSHVSSGGQTEEKSSIHEEALQRLHHLKPTTTRSSDDSFEDAEEHLETITPKVVPLPFHLQPEQPQASPANSQSLSTVQGPVTDATERKAVVPDVSDFVAPRLAPSHASVTPGSSTYLYPQMSTHHSRASSLAATVDDMTDDGMDVEEQQPIQVIENKPSTKDYAVLKSNIAEVQPRDLGEVLHLSTRPKAANSVQQSSVGSRSASHSAEAAPLKKEHLPHDQPWPATTYRTNEWAKYQSSADKPKVEDIAPPSEEGIAVAIGKEEAPAPVHVNELQQTATNAAVVRPQKPRDRSSSSQSFSPANTRTVKFDHQPMNNEMERPRSRASLINSVIRQPSFTDGQINSNMIYSNFNATDRSNRLQYAESQYNARSASGIVRPSSQHNFADPSIGQRSSSMTGYTSRPFVQSPTEASSRSFSANPYSNQQMPYSNPQGTTSATHLGTRQDRVNDRMSIVGNTLRGKRSSSNPGPPLVRPQLSVNSSFTPSPRKSDDNESLHELRERLLSSPVSEDTMSLAQRRELIQQTRPSTSRRLSRESLAFPTSPPLQQHQIYSSLTTPTSMNQLQHDSHQPLRGPATSQEDREARLASWRASQHTSTFNTVNTFALPEERRSAMIAERYQRAAMKERETFEGSRKEREMDNAMRTRSMTELHREALRRMQRQADLNA